MEVGKNFLRGRVGSRRGVQKTPTLELTTPLTELVKRSTPPGGTVEVIVRDAAGVERKLEIVGMRGPLSKEAQADLLEYSLCMNLTAAAMETRETDHWQPYGRLKLGGKDEPMREVEMFKTPAGMLGYRLDGVSYTSSNISGGIMQQFTSEVLKQLSNSGGTQPTAPLVQP